MERYINRPDRSARVNRGYPAGKNMTGLASKAKRLTWTVYLLRYDSTCFCQV